MAHIGNSSTCDAEVQKSGLQVSMAVCQIWGQPGLHELFSQRNNQKKSLKLCGGIIGDKAPFSIGEIFNMGWRVCMKPKSFHEIFQDVTDFFLKKWVWTAQIYSHSL